MQSNGIAAVPEVDWRHPPLICDFSYKNRPRAVSGNWHLLVRYQRSSSECLTPRADFQELHSDPPAESPTGGWEKPLLFFSMLHGAAGALQQQHGRRSPESGALLTKGALSLSPFPLFLLHSIIHEHWEVAWTNSEVPSLSICVV